MKHDKTVATTDNISPLNKANKKEIPREKIPMLPTSLFPLGQSYHGETRS